MTSDEAIALLRHQLQTQKSPDEEEILTIVEKVVCDTIAVARKTGQRFDTQLYAVLDSLTETLQKSDYPIETILHKLFARIVTVLEKSLHEEIAQHLEAVHEAEEKLLESIEKERMHLYEFLDLVETFSKERGVEHRHGEIAQSCQKVEQMLKQLYYKPLYTTAQAR